MSEFDEWYEKESLNGWVDKEWMMIAFEAGQQSRQVEVDALRKRIDEAVKYIEPSDELSHKAYRDLIKILKGTNNEQ